MKAIRAVAAAAALVSVTIAVPAQAQTADLLNALEVRRLVDGGEAADHIGLRDHFLALAVVYDAEARREDALSRAMVGNPNRAWAVAPGAHAARLAQQAGESAATLRKLAIYHERVAAGVPAVSPPGAGRFHHGEGAAIPTDREARALTATARTPADHHAMEEYFVTLAAQHRDVAEAHVRLARIYRVQTGGRFLAGDPAVHCDRAVRLSREAAKRADARALVHRQLARLS